MFSSDQTMRNLRRSWRLGFAMLAAVNVHAETTSSTATPTAANAPGAVTAAAPVNPDAGKIFGNAELRPTWTSNTGQWTGENSVEIGYKFNSKVSLSYLQDFSTRIYDNHGAPGETGVDLNIQRSFLRTVVKDLYKNEATGVSLGYQNRLYAPTNSDDRKNGFITIVRNYFNLKKKLSDSVNFTFSEILIPQFFSRPLNAAGGLNPAFENRFYLTTDINLGKGFTLVAPLMFHQTKLRTSAGTANSGGWRFLSWIYPELDYAINDNWYVGVAYYSANLIKPDFSGLTIGEGLRGGLAQLVLGANL